MKNISFCRHTLPLSSKDTADFLLFGDKLFDSISCYLLHPVDNKELRCARSDSCVGINGVLEYAKKKSAIAAYSEELDPDLKRIQISMA